MIRISFAILPFLLAIPGCLVGDVDSRPGAGDSDLGPGGGGPSGGGGGGGGGGGEEEQADPGTVTLSLGTPSSDLTLGDSEAIDVIVTSVDGYAGDVALSVTGADPSWAVELTPSVVTLAAGEQVTAALTVTIPSNAVATSMALDVVATPMADARDLALSAQELVNVANLMYVRIAAGTGEGTHVWPDAPVKLGATVIFVSDDGTPHRIHAAADDFGFPHQDQDLGVYEVTITQAGSYSFYCHNHAPGSGVGALVVE